MAILSNLGEYLVPLLCGVLGLYVVSRIVVYARLRQFKGPFWAGFSDWPHSNALLQNQCHEWYAEMNEKYGSLARVAPKVLMTSSPDVWIHMNSKPGYKRSDWFYHSWRLEHQRDNLVSLTENKRHDQLRKQLTPGYSGKEVLDLEKTIDQRVQELLNLIRSKYISTADQIVPVDIGRKIQYFTLDVISSVGLSKSFGMLRSDADIDEYIKSGQEGIIASNQNLAMGLSWLPHAPLIGKLFAASPKDNSGFGKMMAACFRSVDEHIANPSDKWSDILASFIRHGLSGQDLRSEALLQIILGSDSTATSIRGALLYLMTNPRVYIKLQNEVDEAARDGRAPRVGEGLISAAQAKKLPYLQAVVREALRIWPPAVDTFPRDIPAGGDTIVVDGETVFLPGGVSVGLSAVALHRREDIYGSDAKEFRPERWFESDPDKLAAMIRTNELNFGYGRFSCLGKPIVLLEVGKTIFELMRNFDLALINPTCPLKSRNCIGLFIIEDMLAQVMDRTA